MTSNPKNPSTLLRGFGADGTSLEKKLKIAAKEAEQRWPIIREIAPTKGDQPAPLTDNEKGLWSAQVPVRATTRKPSLTLPSLGDKLAANLERLAKPKANSRKQTPSTESTGNEFPAKSSTVHSTPTQSLASIEKISTSAEVSIFESPHIGISAHSSSLLSTPSDHSHEAEEESPSDRPIQGIFAVPTSKATTESPQVESNSQVLFSRNVNAPVNNDKPVNSLLEVFARVEGKDLPETNPKSKSTKSFMRRITKR